MIPRIYYSKASITELEIQYATDAARNGWGEKCYEYIERFESMFKAHLGVEYAIATSSCTGAIHLGLAGLDIGRGDEVILADINWIASAAPITYLGATPVLVDILPDTWCIDPQKAEAAITPRTKAIIAVHLYGNLCDMDALLAIGEKYNIPIIEDAAEAIGSVWHGKRAGSIAKFGTFSFHGTKTITTGEGGMFVTNDASLYHRVLTLSNHGRQRGESKQFWPNMIGYKYKMSNLQAAIGCGQMERIDALIARKREIFRIYQHNLAGLPIQINPEPEGTQNGYWMPTIMKRPPGRLNRPKLLDRFASQNIDGRVFFWPLSTTGFFEARHHNELAVALNENAVNLPSYHEMSEAEIISVCSVIREHFRTIE